MDIDFLPGQQAAGLDNLTDIGNRVTCCVHQARISIHAKVPLVASPALVHLFTMHLVSIPGECQCSTQGSAHGGASVRHSCPMRCRGKFMTRSKSIKDCRTLAPPAIC
ncbi:hypothetical protein CtCNB1_3915 [Comamonas thiooxydans]|nr:hypothetical protein CtCNB1_3915 [Comamonas thiooxydans]